MAATLQKQVSQGSPSACLSLGDITFAAAIQRNRSCSSSRSSQPRSRSSGNASDDDTAHSTLFARAGSLYIAGIIWAFYSTSPVLAHRHSPSITTASTSGSQGKTSPSSGSPGLPAQPPVRDYALICNLLRNLTFVIQKAPFQRRRSNSSAALVLPEVQAGSQQQATLHDTLSVLGWTAPTDEEAPSGVVTIPTIAYRLSKQFLPALLHAEDELAASSNAGVRGEEVTDNNGALISVLGDLSSAAAMAHNARGHSSSSSITEPDSAAEESNSNSSYPTSPETRLRRLDISHDQDNDESNEEILNDSPPTTPSQTSSSDDLSKTYTSRPTHPHVAFRNILQERLSGIDTKSSSVGFPRSNTIDTISSGVSSPVSHRSRASSIRSTASSIFERMCGQPKSKTTVSLHAEPQSTMGSFTPVSAKTASTSLRRFGVPSISGTGMWRARTKSRLGLPPDLWDSSDDAGIESDSAAPSPSKPIVRRHARSATVEVP
ncbi:hypothetical protein FRC01_002576, partial [Tulasnella sp. 417]